MDRAELSMPVASPCCSAELLAYWLYGCASGGVSCCSTGAAGCSRLSLTPCDDTASGNTSCCSTGAAGCSRLFLTQCDDTASGGVSCCSTGDAGCCRLCLILGVDASSWHPFRYGTVPGFEHCCAAWLEAVNYCYELRYRF